MNEVSDGFMERVKETREKKLKELDLSNFPFDFNIDETKLTYFPPEFLELEQLEILKLRGNLLLSIPESITRLQNLTTLVLRNNVLSTTPASITRLENLTTLDLSHNEMLSISDSIGNLRKLTRLDLSHNRLTTIPGAIAELQNLTSLGLRNNRISTLPGAIFKLRNLAELDVGDNRLSILPPAITYLHKLKKISLNVDQLLTNEESIASLKNLEEVYFCDNKIPTLPDSIGRLTNITTLSLRGKQLSTLPESIGELRNLTSIDLRNNRLTTLPDSIGDLQKLTSIVLSDNQLTALPHSIGGLQNLKLLDLRNNKLSALPDSIGGLSNLTTLNMGGNRLFTLPESIHALHKLSSIKLSGNRISTLPESIPKLQNLISIDLSYNQLSSLPGSIAHLQKLASIDLKNNKFTSIPGPIYDLRSLEDITFGHDFDLDDLRNVNTKYNSEIANKIREISPKILRLKNLKRLSLDDSFIKTPPPEVVNKSVKAIKDYFRQLEAEGEGHIYEAKLLIVGEAGAGKTTLSKKIENQDYELKSDETSTEGIDVVKWEFPMENGANFRVNIWDFGGQEIYHATHQFFLTRRSLYALVADTRNEDTDFYYWLNVVELFSDNSPLLIVKNEKQDRRREISDRQLRGRFTNLKETLATNLADNRGLPDIITKIKHYISNLSHIGSALPRTWVKVRKTLENDRRDYIGFDEYLNTCKKNGFTSREDMLQLSGYLHDIGVCLHFQGDPLLKKTMILKPEWGTDAVYKVLDNKRVIQNLGRFTRADLEDIWHEEKYATMRDELLQLMIKFKLCYEISENSDVYIAPQLLSENQPKYDWNEKGNLILRYLYEFMPKGIISRFIVVMHDIIYEENSVWKSGVILKKDKAGAEVIEDYNKREIRIRVWGGNKRELMTIVTYEMDKIHKSYQRLKYDKLIPCNCGTCRVSQEPVFYPFDELREFVSSGQAEIQCRKRPFQMVNVLGLIDDVLENHQVDDQVGDAETLDGPELDGGGEELENEVFVSYAWGEGREGIVNQLKRSFQKKGVSIIRDRDELGFKGLIKEFMERIGRGKCVIVVISDKYLKSENCMFELVHIAKNGRFYDRVFPIVLEDARIYRPVECIEYVEYWEKQKDKLNQAMKKVAAEDLQGFRESIDLYAEIRRTVSELTNTLKNMNALTAKEHQESGFRELFKAIEG